jgi:uracil-DNA glycosylase family 4
MTSRSTGAALAAVSTRVIACRRCPRLVAYREAVARARKREFAHFEYWGRPVAGFGDPNARIFLVGLAPAAHGGNRTGRIFTGDGSGDFLVRALHRVGLASQPTSVHRDDGLTLLGAYMASAARCAPPDNRPLPSEFDNCREYLEEEFHILVNLRVILALGQLAHVAALRTAEALGWTTPTPRPHFAHGARSTLTRREGEPIALIASYHPSRQNTNTGRLSSPMMERVLRQAVRAAGL